jgi:signal transduction histidine kinase
LDDPEFRESFLEVAKAEVARIEALVSQFLNLARPTPAVRETVDIGQVIESTARSFSAQAEARRISMNVRIPPHRILLRGDASRLQEALANLLLNALEATPSGGRIELSAEILPPGLDEPPQVKITVWNSGSYILPEDRERIFEPFFTGKATGTGLGLAICHTIVGEHGGRIIVESDVNEGTAFIMRLPVLSSTTESAAMTTP